MKNYLYLVSTPIGNYEDISLRALNILKKVDFIACEEFKEAKRLLSYFKIDKELIPLNEHNEKSNSLIIIEKLLSGKSSALISDCGTPLFSDPGNYLIGLCISNNINLIPVPGANSLLPALVGSGFNIDKFYYYGWLSPKKEIRIKELLELKKKNELIILMDTPYRLKVLMQDVVQFIGKYARCVIAFQLTMQNEKFFRGTANELFDIIKNENLKGEFVLLIDNRK